MAENRLPVKAHVSGAVQCSLAMPDKGIKMNYRLMLSAMVLLFGFLAAPAQAGRATQEAVLEDSVDVLKRITRIPEESIPPFLLRSAQGIAVIPGMIKAGFIIGGSYGKGVLTVKDEKGNWSQPLFIDVAAGSLGYQIGAQSTDIVLVFKTPRSVEGIVHGTFKLGADAAVAAGPVGRRGEAATDAELKAEILSYSRSRGLFAGVSLEGTKLDIDHDANDAYYGKSPRAREILDGKVTGPASSKPFLDEIRKAVAP